MFSNLGLLWALVVSIFKNFTSSRFIEVALQFDIFY